MPGGSLLSRQSMPKVPCDSGARNFVSVIRGHLELLRDVARGSKVRNEELDVREVRTVPGLGERSEA